MKLILSSFFFLLAISIATDEKSIPTPLIGFKLFSNAPSPQPISKIEDP